MKLSIIIPAFNEERNLPVLYERLTAVVQACSSDHELLFVDDGSRDGTLGVLRDLSRRDRRVKFISFSRNFGHEVAVTAGLARAEGDAVVLIDADMQDPPELISEMVERWRAGAEVVYAQRSARSGETALKRLTAFLFYRVIRRISEVAIPADTGHFRLMDRRVVEVLKSCPENPRFTRGLVAWVGFRQEAIRYERAARTAGKTGYNYLKMMRLAMDAVCSFSLVPLRLTAWLGLGVMGVSVLAAAVVVVDKLMNPGVPRGFAFTACAMFFLGGVQLFMLGMLAQYLGYVFKNVQGRPMYVVAEEVGWGAAGRGEGAGGAGSERARVVVRMSEGAREALGSGSAGEVGAEREGAERSRG